VIKQNILEKQAKIAFISIGSNLGNKKLNIELAKFKLQNNAIKIIQLSSDYETSSWPDSSKPKFINIVIKIKTILSAKKLLSICHKIELELGRKRFKKNEPRTCDIDIIDYDQKIIKPNHSTNLTIPHPSFERRNFVLLPLFEISKNWKHPIKKVNIAKLISFLKEEDLRAIKQI
jgi:2-amino-4-hydroxy-6-hydroxymethyldihydropteridine diphosphokinase